MKSSELRGVSTPKLRVLRPVLEAWIEAVHRYRKLQGHEDAPWWFNERASLSTLAGAVWTLPNWAALEEYATTKKGVMPEDKVDEGGPSPERNGRCDLLILGKSTNFAVEAKQAWQSIGSRSSGVANVHKAMRMAWHDAGDLHLDEGEHRLAATFVVPYVPKRDVVGSHPHEVVQRWLSSEPFNVDRRSPAALAYVFPKDVENLGAKDEGKGGYFPGVLLVIEHRQRGNRFTSKRKAGAGS